MLKALEFVVSVVTVLSPAYVLRHQVPNDEVLHSHRHGARLAENSSEVTLYPALILDTDDIVKAPRVNKTCTLKFGRLSDGRKRAVTIGHSSHRGRDGLTTRGELTPWTSDNSSVCRVLDCNSHDFETT